MLRHQFRGYLAQVGLHERHPEHGQQVEPLIGGRGGEHEHSGAQFGKGVGDGKTGHPEAEHGDPQVAPVGVPAHETVQTIIDAVVTVHQRESHSR